MKKALKLIVKYLLGLTLIGVIAMAMFFGAVYVGVFGSLPTTEELASIQNEEASLVMASNGNVIGKYFAENRTNIGWNDIPEHLIDALVATEDKRFYLHEGYDSRSYFRVFFKTILLGDRSSGGGSTLTQQLVKNLYGRNYHSFLSMPVNKLKEAIIAVRMENVLTKQQILLLYLNSVPFGEDVYGIEAASMRFYNKRCKNLSVDESAVLVGALKANTYYNPRMNPENAISRRNQVLALMADQKYITPKELEKLIAKPLNISYANYQIEPPAGYFVYQVRQRVDEIVDEINLHRTSPVDLEKDGLRIYTTLDIDLQKSAQRAVKKQLYRMQKLLDNELKNSRIKKKFYTDNKNSSDKKECDVFTWDKKPRVFTSTDSLWYYHSMLNAAVLAINPNDGSVLTWVGGNNFRYLPYDLVKTKRQVASAIKPIVYSAALEKNLVPCDYLSNELVVYREYDGWTPRNYDGSSSKDTLVALWYALANSMNLPTMDLYFKTGYDDVSQMIRRFGLVPPNFETPSVALGSMDVSLYEIVKAYGTFANEGYMTEDLVMIDKIIDANGEVLYERSFPDEIQVIPPHISDQINHILKKAVNEGTGRSMRSRFGVQAELAGKTGTAQNYSNAWFMSYTPEIVIGTWVGAMSPEVHFRGGMGSGSALALPISGYIYSDIENNNALSRKYLSRFDHNYSEEELIHCDPYYEKGLKGFINRLTDDDQENEVVTDTLSKDKPKKKSKVRKFFENIFGGKKKKKKN